MLPLASGIALGVLITVLGFSVIIAWVVYSTSEEHNDS